MKQQYSEAEVRDLIAANLQLFEKGLTFVDKEHYLPNGVGTRGFIDILAKDKNNKLVVIEVKKSDSTAREALHEVFKYLEGVKLNLGLKDEEIRLIIISTNWRELIVPFSSAYQKSKINMEGYKISFSDSSISKIELVVPLQLNNDRMFCDHHMLRAYTSEKRLEKGILNHLQAFENKKIDDFVLIILVARESQREKELRVMEANFLKLSRDEEDVNRMMENIRNNYPDYRYIIYSATQLQQEQKYWDIIKTQQNVYDEIIDIIENYCDEDRLNMLHDYAIDVALPVPKCDTAQIGYAAKLQNYIECEGWYIERIIRGRRFDNEFLDDSTILNELIGGRGTTKQKYSQKFSSSNRTHLQNIKKDISYCLQDNKQWQVPILNIIDNLVDISDIKQFRGKVYIFNPMHIIYTIYLIEKTENIMQWAPNFYILVEYADSKTMYFGGLKQAGIALPWEKIIEKHFEPNLSDLALSLTWGGYMHNDIKIVNDLGLTYGIYRLDMDNLGNKRTFMEYINFDFEPCVEKDQFSDFAQYLQEEPQIVGEILKVFDDFFPA